MIAICLLGVGLGVFSCLLMRRFFWWYFGIGKVIGLLASIDASLKTLPAVRRADYTAAQSRAA